MIKNLMGGLPEIGKIKIGRLGDKRKAQSGREYQLPVKLDYFLVTTLERGDDGNFKRNDPVHQSIGDRPTVLGVRLIYNDPDLNFMTRYACYDGRKLFCSGDGEMAQRLKGDKGKRKECECPCERLEKGFEGRGVCKPSGILSCILDSDQTVGGVHKLRTTGWNTVVNITSGLKLIDRISGGHSSGVPLKLIHQMKSIVLDDGKQTTAPVVGILFSGSMQQLADAGAQVALGMAQTAVRIEHIESIARKEMMKDLDMLTEGETVDDVVNEFHPEEAERASEEDETKATGDPKPSAKKGDSTSAKKGVDMGAPGSAAGMEGDIADPTEGTTDDDPTVEDGTPPTDTKSAEDKPTVAPTSGIDGHTWEEITQGFSKMCQTNGLDEAPAIKFCMAKFVEGIPQTDVFHQKLWGLKNPGKFAEAFKVWLSSGAKEEPTGTASMDGESPLGEMVEVAGWTLPVDGPFDSVEEADEHQIGLEIGGWALLGTYYGKQLFDGSIDLSKNLPPGARSTDPVQYRKLIEMVSKAPKLSKYAYYLLGKDEPGDGAGEGPQGPPKPIIMEGSKDSPADNWWNNSDHFMHRKAESISHITRIGFGLNSPFREKDAKGNATEKPFRKIVDDNSDAFGTLEDALPESCLVVMNRFIKFYSVEQWNDMMNWANDQGTGDARAPEGSDVSGEKENYLEEVLALEAVHKVIFDKTKLVCQVTDAESAEAFKHHFHAFMEAMKACKERIDRGDDEIEAKARELSSPRALKSCQEFIRVYDRLEAEKREADASLGGDDEIV
jgi:hypothetical protein